MAKEEKKKEKRPTALKRDLQNQKRNLENRVFKSSVSTALRSLEDKCVKGEILSAKEALNKAFSLVDKGVKNGRFKKNKANRMKSRIHQRVQSLKVATA